MQHSEHKDAANWPHLAFAPVTLRPTITDAPAAAHVTVL